MKNLSNNKKNQSVKKKKKKPVRKKSIFAKSYKDMERHLAKKEEPFSQSEIEEMRQNRYLKRSAWEYWKRYFGGNSKEEREAAVARLGRWVDLESVLIPDNGADKMVMAGKAWIYQNIPGEELTEIIQPFGLDGQEGLGLKIMRGKTCYLSPEGTPIAILVCKWGSAKPHGETRESLLSEAQLNYLGCKDSTIGGIKQYSHHSWSEPLHALPRGEGYLVPIRRPSKVELETLPHWNLTVDYHDIGKMLTRMVEKTAALGAQLGLEANTQQCNPDAKRGHKRALEDLDGEQRLDGEPKLRRQATKSSKKDASSKKSKTSKMGGKKSEVEQAGVSHGGIPAPTRVGPRQETAAEVAKALEEWRKILALPDVRAVERSLKVNTAEAVDMECEKRSFPRAIMKTRFPFLRPKYLGEACFTDVIEYKTDGVTKYQQTFLTQSSKYPYVVDIQDTGKSNEAIEKFIREVGVPTVMVSDNFRGINKSKKVKRLAGKLHMKLTTSEAHKQNGNKVERLNGTLKQKSARMMSEGNIDPFYTGYAIKYAAHVLRYTAHEALNWRTPIEALTGETGDISHLRFCFGDPVWYCSSAREFPMNQMLKGMYLGPAESTGDEACHHILPIAKGKRANKSSDKGKARAKRRFDVIQRSYVTIRDPQESSFREIHKSYERGFLFPRYLFPSRYDREGTPWNVLKALDRSNNKAIDAEFVRRAHARRHPIVPKGAEESDDSQGLEANELCNLADKLREELQAEELAQDPDAAVEYSIIGHKMQRGLVKFKVISDKTGLITEANFEDCRADIPGELAHYIEENGVGKGRKGRPERPFYAWAKELLKLQRQVIRRVKKTTWASNTYDVMGGMGAAHKIGRIRRVSAKAKRRQSTGPRMKYGVRVPSTVEEAYQLDAENGDTLWADAIALEIDALMRMRTLNFPKNNHERAQMALDIKTHGYQYAATWIVFDVKANGRRKARLVIGGHMVDSDNLDKFCTHMTSESNRILMTIADHMGYDVNVGDINNAYLCASTNEKIYTIGGLAFVKGGHALHEDDVAFAAKAQYGLGTSGFEWYMMLADQLRALGYKRSRGDPDVWFRSNGDEYYDYIGTYTDDLLVVSKNIKKATDELKQWYSFKGTEEPTYHLGVDYVKGKNQSDKVKWQLGSFTYVKEAIAKIETLLKEEGYPLEGRTRKNPMDDKAHPELFDGELCSDEQHTLYMQLIGIYLWLVQIGRCDIGYAVSSLSRFSALPRKAHLDMAVELLYYLRRFPDKRITVDASPMPSCKSARCFSKDRRSTLQALYPEAVEEIDPKFPQPRGEPLQTSVWFDANNAHDKKTRKSVEGYMLFVGSTLVKAKSKRQGSIASSTYVSEIHAGRTASEEVMDLRYLLRSLGMKLDGPTLAYGDNESSIKSVTEPESPLNKRHVGISYHTARECEAANITTRFHVKSEDNLSDGLTKALPNYSHYKLYKDGGPVFSMPFPVSNAK